MIKELLQPLFQLIYPSLCLSCQTFEPINGSAFCLACEKELPFISSAADAKVSLIGKDSFPGDVSNFYSLFYYTKEGLVADMMHRLKYHGHYKTGRFLGSLLAERMAKEGNFREFIIVPVPIHIKRLRERGYNQALEIARGMQRKLDVPCCPDYLKREEYRVSQTTKGKDGRQNALNMSFKINPAYEHFNNILLVDDVVTTGATIQACYRALTKEGEANISVATLGTSV